MAHLLYTIQPGDEAEGLLGIARRLYGDPARWTEIYQANRYVIGENPSVVRAGQQLAIADGGPELPAHIRQHTYHVQIADITGGLSGIANRLWGQPERWRELYAVNRGAIGDDPHALQPGQKLIIP